MSDEPRQLGKCIRCDKAIMSYGDILPDNPDGAMEGVVAGNYGSRHDFSSLKVWLCDDCADAHRSDMQTYGAIYA